MANPMYGQNKADNAIDVGSCVYVDGDYTLKTSEAGSTVIMADSAAKTIKLPADVIDGMTFDFAYVAAAAEADMHSTSGGARPASGGSPGCRSCSRSLPHIKAAE